MFCVIPPSMKKPNSGASDENMTVCLSDATLFENEMRYRKSV